MTSVNKYPGLFDTNAGGIRITDKLLTCLGVKTRDEFIKGFTVSDPIPTYDKDGNLTGARFELFQVNRKDGTKKKLGIRSVRSKQGATGKLETAYKWHGDMQRCFKGTTQ